MQLNTIKPFQPHYNCHTEDCRLNFQLPCHVALPWRSRQHHPCLPKRSLAHLSTQWKGCHKTVWSSNTKTKAPLILVVNKSLVKMGQYQVQWKHVISLSPGSLSLFSLSLSLSTYISVYLSAYLAIYISIYLATCPCTYPPILLSHSMSICLSIYLSIYPSILRIYTVNVLWQINSWYQLIRLHWRSLRPRLDGQVLHTSIYCLSVTLFHDTTLKKRLSN